MRLELIHKETFLELDPMAGGTVSRLRHRDLDVLRPAPERIGPAFDPIKYAAFPMLPFVGRIHEGRFEMEGLSYELPANFPPEPHAIHGHGWHAAWKVEASSADSATLIYRHTADTWPWDYTARQTFRVLNNAVTLGLSITNLSDSRMPAGLGWHPYFPREHARLTVPSTHVWTPDEATGDNRPTAISAVADLSNGQCVDNLNLDTTFSLNADTIKASWPTHAIMMRSDPVFSHATIYIPPGEDYFCAEPITHAPNAINSALPVEETGFRTLDPGDTLSGSITLSIEH